MMRIKTQNKVMFNMSERELCKECGYPDGFCKHTIEEQYKERCPKTPLNKEGVWQLVRSHAICETEKRNLFNNTVKQIHLLEKENGELSAENEELKNFKKHIKDIITK